MKAIIDRALRDPYWTAIGVIVAAIGVIVAFYGVHYPRGTNESKPISTPVLTMEIEAWINVSPESYKEGLLYEFTLSNPMSGIAIVESISVKVLDVIIEDFWPEQAAFMSRYEYELVLDPDFRGRREFATNFKYATGEADRFAVQIRTSKNGYDYFFRFVVVWRDELTSERSELYSDVMAAKFPVLDGPARLIPPEERRSKFFHHSKRVEQIADQLNNKSKRKSELHKISTN